MLNENSQELPRYKLLEPAYIGDILYDTKNADDHYGIVHTKADVIPGPHMEPLNDAAREQMKKIPKGADPILSLPLNGNGDPDIAHQQLVSLLTALLKAQPAAGAAAPSAPSMTPEEIEDRIQAAVAVERNRLQDEFDAKLDEVTAPKGSDEETP